jgi:hypothetical protein
MAGTYVLLWPKLFSPESRATGGFQVPGAGSKPLPPEILCGHSCEYGTCHKFRHF